jgi:eIF3 subunit 6 N terminal domain
MLLLQLLADSETCANEEQREPCPTSKFLELPKSALFPVQYSFRHSSDSIMAVEEAEAVAAAPAGAHKYDLTNTISEYLDLHLMFPLLDFVEISGMYPGQGVAQARLELLEPTNMVRKRIDVV